MPNNAPPASRSVSLLSLGRHAALAIGLVALMSPGFPSIACAQAAPASPSARQIGTVKAVEGNVVTLGTDSGPQVSVSVAPNARILQVPPGSTDLKTAQAATLSDIAIGDRILVNGAAGDTPAQFSAARVIVMKSTALAEKHQSEQADWQRRSTGGIVSAIDPTTGTLTVSSGTRKLEVKTSPKTIFRRYAGDSVKFEDAKLGTMSQIQVGDQLRVRGGRSQTDAGTTVDAEEIVSGSFKNLSGTLLTVDAATGHITLKDLTTKRNMTVLVTANSELHALPPEAAERFAARQRGGAAGAAPNAGPGSRPASQATAASVGKVVDGAHPNGDPSATPAHPAGSTAPATGRAAGGDLSQLVARLPPEPIASLHPGEAVMIVASSPTPASDSVTAVTLLSGVEPILAAAPSGGAGAMTLSPWSVGGGGGGAEGAGGGAEEGGAAPR